MHVQTNPFYILHFNSYLLSSKWLNKWIRIAPNHCSCSANWGGAQCIGKNTHTHNSHVNRI